MDHQIDAAERQTMLLHCPRDAAHIVAPFLFFDLPNRRVEWEASGYFMDFYNLVISTVDQNGNPGLTNAGNEHFKGFETGASVYLPHDFLARTSFTYQDARFINFLFDFGDGNGPTQLAGKRQEMSPNHLASASLFYMPLHGFLGGVSMNYTGNRFLNKRNTAPADGFASVDLSAGYRTARWELRVDARNVGDRRDPVSESEFGDAQYYLMTARRVDLTAKEAITTEDAKKWTEVLESLDPDDFGKYKM